MVTRREFDKYREVQKEGKYNMLSSEAIAETGLSKDTYFEIIENYDELYEQYSCALSLIKNIRPFAAYTPSLYRLASNTDIVYFNKDGLSLPLPVDVREQVYEAEEAIEGIVYAVIDSECDLGDATVLMRSFLFYSILDEDEPVFAASYDNMTVTTYAYVMNLTWDIQEAGSISIKELPFDGRIIRTA